MKLFFLLTGLLLSFYTSAQVNYTWSGSVSTSWNNSGNWTPAGVPTTIDNVQIVTGANNCILDASAVISNLTLTSGILDLNGVTLSVQGTTAVFSSGVVQNGNLLIPAAGNVTFGTGSVTMNCTVNIHSASLQIRNATFNGYTHITKTGATHDGGNNNIFNAPVTITNAGAGNLTFGNTNADQFNTDLTVINSGSAHVFMANSSAGNYFGGVTTFHNESTGNGNIYVSQYSAGTVFDGGIVVSATGGNGVFFCNGGAASATITSGHTISVGAPGFSQGSLSVRRFTQQGATPVSLTLGGTAELVIANNSQFNAAVTVSSPNMYISHSVFDDNVTLTKTDGASSNAMGGGNVFNGTLTANYFSSNGTGYWSFANGNPDIYNGDVYSNNNSLDRIIFGHNAAGNQFNGDFIITQTGSSSGTALTWNTASSSEMAAGKTIRLGAGGMDAGYFYVQGITQHGSEPVNLHTTGDVAVYLGAGNGHNHSVIGGPVNVTAENVYIRGATFHSDVVITKTGGTSNHNEGRQNIFNGVLTINQQSNTGYFMLGYNSNDRFNENIIVNATGTGGINLGWTSGSGNPELAAGKTIVVGAAGYHAGQLQLGGFVQHGNAPITLELTGTALLRVYSNDNPSVFGGPFSVQSPDIYIRGGIFNNTTTFTKTGGVSNHNSGRQNIFNGLLTINQQSSSGYFMLSYNSEDLFNEDIVLNATGTGGICFGWADGTGTPVLAAGKTMSVGVDGFSAGYLRLSAFTQLGTAPTNLTLTGTAYIQILQNGISSNFGGPFTVTAPDIYVQGGIFNGDATFIKTGGVSNSNSNRRNVFNGLLTIHQQSNSGYFMLGHNSNDLFNEDIIVTCTGSGGIYLGSSGTGTPTLAAGRTILVGAAGFNDGFLTLNRFTQLGTAPMNLNFNGTTTTLRFALNSVIGGNLVVSSPDIYFDGATFNGVVNATKTGTRNNASRGGNVFNGQTSFTVDNGGYFLMGNTDPDTWNADVVFTNNGIDRILPCWGSAGNQFNGDIYVNTISGTGIHFCGGNSSATATLAAGKTIQSGISGLHAGYLILRQFTQLGNTPVNLTLGNTASYLQFGPSSAFGGNVTSVSPGLYFNGCTFSGTVNSTKTGTTSDASSGNNMFDNNTTITNSGSGYLLMGNGNRDQFNSIATFNNTGAAHFYIAHNSSNNHFGGVTTFNNTTTADRGIYVSSYSTGTVFTENIIVSSTGGQGVQFCASNATASATLATGKTISVGAGGFSAGTLLLKQFTQVGAAPQALSLTGSGRLTFGPSSAFGGNVTSVSPGLYFNGCTFSGTVNSTKTGATNDASNGNNVFHNNTTIINSGDGYLLMGNGNRDQFNSVSTFNNTGTANLHVAYNSSNNIFGGVATFNNSGSGQINVSPYSAGTVFNGNIIVSSVSGQGVQFCASNATASVTLVAGNAIGIGSSGFSSGTLLLKQFTQVGATPQALSLTGSGRLAFGPVSAFGGAVNASSPGLLFNGCNFASSVQAEKTGATNDQSVGNNIFNGVTALVNNGTGYLMMSHSLPDVYNGNVSFEKNNTGIIYPNYNHNSAYAGNVNVSSATVINFGANTGTATFNGAGPQLISASAGTPVPTFSRLVINNTGSGVSLNTPVTVYRNLDLNSGLLHTTETNILTMLNNATVAAGNALSVSYVNGPMRYQKASAGSTVLNFPVGNAPDCRPVVLTVAHTSSTSYIYQVRLYNASAAALGYTLPPTVDEVSSVHYYTINRMDASGNNQPTAGLSGNQTIEIFFGANDLVTDGNATTIVKNTHITPGAWIDIGGAGAPPYDGGVNLTGSITSTSSPTAFNSFSEFAIAFRQLIILPVQLLEFKALRVENKVNISWAAAGASVGDYYIIEKSRDGMLFEALTTVQSRTTETGGQVKQYYTTTDNDPFEGRSYYRVKRTGVDGKIVYSDIASVYFNRRETVSVYPNPSAGTIHITGLPAGDLPVEWYDVSGRIVLRQVAVVSAGTAVLSVNLPDGIYILKYGGAKNAWKTEKIIIRK
ncbi:MAG: T9SS type A sorting domain-containing protein [Chitinophagaceae bacterium]|nr:T9SS type A sorting domain-containing protein [Chitinophagaceae bacterium]MCW5926674.1 T9SS type A sorting domain-containing protein [Chitinophagaceae bacterium]